MSIFKFYEHKNRLDEEWFPIPVIENFLEETHHPRVWKPTILATAIVPRTRDCSKKK